MSMYGWGVIAGILVVAVLAAVIFALLRGTGPTGFSEKAYDERQQRARALSFKAGFFTLLIYEALYAVTSCFLEPWCERSVGSFLGIIVGVTVFAVVSVMRDAYIPVRDNPRRTAILLGVIALVNALCALRYLFDPEESMIADGLLTYRCMNLVITVMFIILFAAMLIKRGLDRREEAE